MPRSIFPEFTFVRAQQVTWFNLENYVTISNAQLELLRDAQTTAVGSQIFLMGGHQTFKAVLFPFFAIFIGTATLHLLTKYCTWLPYTVAGGCRIIAHKSSF